MLAAMSIPIARLVLVCPRRSRARLTKAKINQVEPLLIDGFRLAKEEILRLHVAMYIPGYGISLILPEGAPNTMDMPNI